jgi:hypothetical protein
MNTINTAKHTIEIDGEVFKMLQDLAEPLVDTPNSVLRGLLLSRKGVPETLEIKSVTKRLGSGYGREVDTKSTESYIRQVWSTKFKGQPRQVRGYRMMFESEADIVYFQNFNKTDAENLWFRLNSAPLRTMKSKKQKAWVCFTNPADNYGFLIPLTEIEKKIDASGWSREDWEVNIHVSESKWRELDWRLDQFEFQL